MTCGLDLLAVQTGEIPACAGMTWVGMGMTWVGMGMTWVGCGNDVDRWIYGLGAVHTGELGSIRGDRSNGTIAPAPFPTCAPCGIMAGSVLRHLWSVLEVWANVTRA